MALRVANNYSIDGVTLLGCYVAPAYKAAGSSSHCDTLQASRSSGSGGIRNLRIQDSVFFQSSSQVFMMEQTRDVTLAHSAFLGGLRGTGRYPIGSGRHVMTGQNTLWGKTTDPVIGVNVADSLIAGSIRAWSFATATNTVVSQTPAPTASGSFTVETGIFDTAVFSLVGQAGADATTISCKITFEGEVLAEQTSTGAYSVVTCTSTNF